MTQLSDPASGVKESFGEAGSTRRRYVRLGNRRVRVPASRSVRIAGGSALVVGGVFGFLPVLGFWMLPLGLLVLSIDSAPVRRQRRRLEVRIGRWRLRRRGPATAADPLS